MLDFTIMSAQASVEARFDDPLILEGYGFSFFGAKGYTFSPVFARDHVVVQFQGHFVDEIPDDKFTVVLKKVRGEDSVPLFQTLTFHINAVHPYHTMALYEMSEQMFEYVSTSVSDAAMAVYAVLSVVLMAAFYFLTKYFLDRRQAKQNAQIEAFSYEETDADTKKSSKKEKS